MPIYEYACASCEHEFEVLARSMDEKPPKSCPECGSANVARKLSVFAARQGASQPTISAAGGCGRCGDPAGPCSM